jgi:hypothetical protein
MGNLFTPHVRLENKMQLRKRDAKPSSLDECKKTAYSINRRMKELGYQSPLAHAYELVATAFGFKNWATLKNLVSPNETTITIGKQTRLVTSNGEAARVVSSANFEIKGPSCFNHFEVVGDREKCSRALKSIQESNTSISSHLVYICSPSELNKLGRSYGSEAPLKSQFPEQEVSTKSIDLFSMLTATELSNAFKRAIVDSETEDAPGFVWRQRTARAIAAITAHLAWLRDASLIKLDAESILSSIQLKSIVEAVSNLSDMPQPTRKVLLDYLNSLPGFNFSKGINQSQTTADHHGYVEMLIARLLEAFQRVKVYSDNERRTPRGLEHRGDGAKTTFFVIPRHSPEVMRFAVELAACGAFQTRDSSADCDKPTLVFIDGADNVFEDELEDTMSKASDNNTILFFAWQKPPRSHALKRASTILVDAKIDHLLTVITPSQKSIIAI